MTDSAQPFTPVEEVVASYTWIDGHSCFRCRRSDVPTARVGQLLPGGGPIDVQACPSCTIVMERQREVAAHRYGWPYHPGTPTAHHS